VATFIVVLPFALVNTALSLRPVSPGTAVKVSVGKVVLATSANGLPGELDCHWTVAAGLARAMCRAATSAAGRTPAFASGRGSDFAGRKPGRSSEAKVLALSCSAVME
jgi:hypothetical protein